MKINTLLLVLEFFSVSLACMETRSEKNFHLSGTDLNNTKMLQKASEYCNKNKDSLIILVDDGKSNRMIMIRPLGEKFAFITLESGDDLLKILRSALIDDFLSSSVALILDNQMPGMYGVEIMATMVKEEFIAYRSQRPLAVLNTSDDLDTLDREKLDHFSLILKAKNNWQEVDKKLEELGQKRDTQPAIDDKSNKA